MINVEDHYHVLYPGLKLEPLIHLAPLSTTFRKLWGHFGPHTNQNLWISLSAWPFFSLFKNFLRPYACKSWPMFPLRCSLAQLYTSHLIVVIQEFKYDITAKCRSQLLKDTYADPLKAMLIIGLTRRIGVVSKPIFRCHLNLSISIQSFYYNF